MSIMGVGGGVNSTDFMLRLSVCVFFLVCSGEHPGRLELSQGIAVQPPRARKSQINAGE